MEINANDFYLFTDYSSYGNRIISFPDFLKENNLEISNEDFKEYLHKYKLKTEIQNTFSKYIQKIHTDLEWICDVIEESKKDMYIHLLHITNVGLKLNYKDPNFEPSDAENLTISITNRFQFETESKYNVEMSNKSDELIPNYGYKVFLEFKKYLLEKTKITLNQKPKTKLSNPKKLALLCELGIFDLPLMKGLSDEQQNEIIGLILDADKKEFVYKNRLNINSKDPNYQIDKYGSYKYLEEMRTLINNLK